MSCATGNSETHFLIVYRYNLLMYFSPCAVCVLRPILNLAWNSITNGVYMLANCSECCVMLARDSTTPLSYNTDRKTPPETPKILFI